jgi:hypothetical protein
MIFEFIFGYMKYSADFYSRVVRIHVKVQAAADFAYSNVVSDFIGKSHDTLADLNWSAVMQVYALGWCRDVPVSMEEEAEGLGECGTHHLYICHPVTPYREIAA